MDLAKIYLEEDLFPKDITSWIERPYGFLFYNDENKESYDSNHALVFRNRVTELDQVLEDIVQFYSEKGIRPSIYQSIADDGYFEHISDELTRHGFSFWTEPQNYMVLLGENKIQPNPNITVQKVTRWDDAFATHIFEAAGEPWEIDVARKALDKANTLFFVAYDNSVPVGMTHCHVADGVCRVDYLLVATNCRNKGVGRALIHYFVEYCVQNHIENCYLWPDGETAANIYQEAGFRTVAVKQAGRAVARKEE
jgi:GNAT superfamily N-acetyltransferase